MRCFASVPVSEPASQRLRALQGEARSFCSGSFPREFHLTLAFYGETNRVDSLAFALGEVKFEPFEVVLKGAGCFPGGSKPRVLLAGAESPGLYALQSRVAEASGYSEARPFHAHATLCRIRSCNARGLADWIRDNEGEIARFRVNSFALMESELKPSGAVHSLFKEYAASAP